MRLRRLLRHLLMPHWWVLRVFDREARQAVEAAVADSERQHRGELRFVVEGLLPVGHLIRGVSARQRAEELFAQLRIWDTAENSGILIYVQLADRRSEILADRGIAAQVPQAEWDGICRGMARAFASGDYRGGALQAVREAGEILIRHFPAADENPNELPDRPLVL